MSAKSCPVCQKPVDAAHKPFCSRRCADMDLGRWFSGSYAIPAEEPPDSDESTGEEPAPES